MSKKLIAATEGLTAALATFVQTTVEEAMKGADIAVAMPKSKGNADEDEDDEPAKPSGKAREAALKQLRALDLDDAGRPDMKPIADALGLDTAGKKSTELREMLKAELKKASKKATADEDDDEEETPKKKKKVEDDEDEDEAPKKRGPGRPRKVKDEDEDEAPKKKKPAADEDEDEEIETPDAKTMKKEVKIFCLANKASIVKRDKHFFDSDEDSDDEDMPRLHQILADPKLLKKTWTDNVAELKLGNGKAWKQTVAKAEAAAEDDD